MKITKTLISQALISLPAVTRHDIVLYCLLKIEFINYVCTRQWHNHCLRAVKQTTTSLWNDHRTIPSAFMYCLPMVSPNVLANRWQTCTWPQKKHNSRPKQCHHAVALPLQLPMLRSAYTAVVHCSVMDVQCSCGAEYATANFMERTVCNLTPCIQCHCEQDRSFSHHNRKSHSTKHEVRQLSLEYIL